MGIARQVPPEAYRRFCQDYSQRREKNFEKRSRQLALHEERDRFVADWVDQHGTPNQRERYSRGMLPLKEVLECVADAVFTAARHKPLYVRDGGNQLQEYLRQFPKYGDVVVAKADLLIEGSNAETATESQWVLVRELQQLLADASVTLRVQRLSWKKDVHAPVLRTFLVLVTQQVGPFIVRREYLAPER